MHIKGDKSMRKMILFLVFLASALFFISCGGIVNINDLEKPQVILNFPFNQATDVATSCVLRWTVDGLQPQGLQAREPQVEYKISMCEAVEGADYPENPATTSQTEYSIPELKRNTTYKWQIEAVFGNGVSVKSEERTFKTVDEEIGAFKIVNSWGVGFSGENVPDGYYWMTYATLKNNIKYVYVIDKTYVPTRAIAVFQMNHPIRGDCNISVGIGSPDQPKKSLNFSGNDREFFWDGGDYPYPDHCMVLDITELLPIENESVFLKVFDEAENEAVGRIESFSVEVYDVYDSAMTQRYNASDLPVDTVNGQSVSSQIQNLTISSSSSRNVTPSPLMQRGQSLTEWQYRELRASIGTAVKTERYNPVFNGNGTGYRPPTCEEWEYLYTNDLLKEIKGYDTRAAISQIDHSESKYFPPVGSQGSKGSCSSWATTYYTGTFYNAMRYDWDLSAAEWIENDVVIDGELYDMSYPTPEYQDKIQSPDFTYLQLNEGKTKGTSIFGNLKVLNLIGTSNWKECPYNVLNFTQWPSEEAWRDAPKKRLNWKADWEFTVPNTHPWYYLKINTDEDIETMKNLLAEGYLITLSIQASCYENLDENDVWHTTDYATTTSNHANTIVGFDDSVR